MEQILKSKLKTMLKSNRKFMAIYSAFKERLVDDELIKNDLVKFRTLNDGRFSVNDKDLMLFLNDKTEQTDFDRHYVFHIGWASRILAKIRPKLHVDISSSIFFNVVASAFVNVEFYDYRPARLNLTGIKTGKSDLCNLHFETNSVESLSCMHVIEHVGLGRYGDAIDPKGDLKAAAELSRVLKKNGHLMIVVPVGKSRIEFNAHRIYSYELLLDLFPDLRLVEYTLIPDNREDGDIMLNPDPSFVNSQNWGCGCFLFSKE